MAHDCQHYVFCDVIKSPLMIFPAILFSETIPNRVKPPMSFLKFQVNKNSTPLDLDPSSTTSLQTINTTPGPANLSTQMTHPIPVTTPLPINPSQYTVLHTSGSNSRTRLDPGDQLVLVRLSVLNQSDYVEGKKREFWSKISILLEQETGKRLKDPASSMKLLVAGRPVCIY